MSKDYSKSTILSSYFASNKNASPEKVVNVGNNGYTLGQEFHATGLTVVPANTAANIPSYIAITTQEGPTLSLKSVMSISSLNGYHTTGEFENETGTSAKKETTMVRAEVVSEFDFSDVFQPSTRNFYDFVAETENGYWNGKTITYLGKAVRPYVAKKKSATNSSERFEAGLKRAMQVKLWSVK